MSEPQLRWCHICEKWFDLADLDVIPSDFGMIDAIDPKTKRAHSFARNRRYEQYLSPPTPKPEPEVLVVTKEFWKFVPPPPSLVDDDELAQFIDKVLKTENT